MNGKKIAVLVRKSHPAKYAQCMAALQKMKWPQDHAAEVFTLSAGEPYARQVNAVLKETDARVKIYIDDDLRLVFPQAVEEILTIFQDGSIGMVGFLGSRSLPVSGNLMESPYVCGAVYVPSEKGLQEARFGSGAVGEWQDVRFLAPSFFATQGDFSWDEDYKNQYYAVLAYSRRFEQQEKRLVVPTVEKPWCAYQGRHISFDADEGDRKRFFAVHHAYLTDDVSPDRQMLYACGEDSAVDGWQNFSLPEAISIGAHTKIHETALCRAEQAEFAGAPRIVVGDACAVDAYSTLTAASGIVLENFVTLAPNVHLVDFVQRGGAVGLAVRGRSSISEVRGIRIGYGTRLEENVVVRGAVQIGRGCIVRAGSVVRTDIPDYCVAEGNPSHVVQAFSSKEGRWLPVNCVEDLAALLAEREKTPPMLTYAIITYNRSRFLAKSLESVLQQAGNDALVVVLVSDNASTDDTRSVVEGLQQRYRNLRYHCNEQNIGAEGNVHVAMRESRGEYVIVAGDDDYLVDGTLYSLLDLMYQYRGYALFYRVWSDDPSAKKVYTGSGCLNYLALLRCGITWLSTIAMRRELYDAIEDPHKYDATRLPQVYLQMEILKQKPEFAILEEDVFTAETGDHFTTGFDVAEVFIQNYLHILQETAAPSPEQMSLEKKKVMERVIYPWCWKIKAGYSTLSLEKLFDIVERYYRDEAFYPEILAKLKEILGGNPSGRGSHAS